MCWKRHGRGCAPIRVRHIQESLRSKTYVPKAVRRVYIPESEWQTAAVGDTEVRDRVVQMATLFLWVSSWAVGPSGDSIPHEVDPDVAGDPSRRTG